MSITILTSATLHLLIPCVLSCKEHKTWGSDFDYINVKDRINRSRNSQSKIIHQKPPSGHTLIILHGFASICRWNRPCFYWWILQCWLSHHPRSMVITFVYHCKRLLLSFISLGYMTEYDAHWRPRTVTLWRWWFRYTLVVNDRTSST